MEVRRIKTATRPLEKVVLSVTYASFGFPDDRMWVRIPLFA